MASASWTSSTDHVEAVSVVGLHAEDVGGAGVRKASSGFPKGTPRVHGSAAEYEVQRAAS